MEDNDDRDTAPDYLERLAEQDKQEGEVVELSTIPNYLENWEPLPPKKKADPARVARRKRAKQARKKNR